MKVLVTGGTGFVGREIVRQLHTRGHQVRLLVRDPSSQSARAAETKFGAELCAGDILDSAALARFCSSGDALLHLVGIISEVGSNTFENIHHHGTVNLVNAARHARISRFIHMSALGTREHAKSRYHQSKWAGESVVRESGLQFTIMRPSIIYGPGDAFTTLFARMARFSPFLPVMGAGEGTFQPVAVESVAKCFVHALAEPPSIGRTFDIGGPEVLTLNEVLDVILSVTRRRRFKLHFPLPVARTMAVLLEAFFPALLRKPPPLNRDQIQMLQEKTVGDLQPAIEILQLASPTFREGLQKYLGR